MKRHLKGFFLLAIILLAGCGPSISSQIYQARFTFEEKFATFSAGYRRYQNAVAEVQADTDRMEFELSNEQVTKLTIFSQVRNRTTLQDFMESLGPDQITSLRAIVDKTAIVEAMKQNLLSDLERLVEHATHLDELEARRQRQRAIWLAYLGAMQEQKRENQYQQAIHELQGINQNLQNINHTLKFGDWMK